MNHEAINNARRKINEIMTKQQNRIVVGWRPGTEPKREEGETWSDSEGRQWEMKNGIRIRKTKLDGAKTPWFCPKCNKVMNHKIDDKFWRIRGHCFDCNIKAEMELRKQGKWKEYENKVMLRNYIAQAKDKIAELQHYHDTISKPEYLNVDEQTGVILETEKWNVNIEKIRADLQADIQIIQTALDETIAKYGIGEENEIEDEKVSGIDEING